MISATCVSEIDWERWTPHVRGVLCFILRGEEVLLILKKRGMGSGMFNAPGGKIEPGETALAAAIRETQEEIGVTPHEPQSGGELYFQFTDGHRLHCEVFTASGFDGTPIETDEARPFWNSRHAIPYHQMWEDDAQWLPLLLAGKRFCGYFIFDDKTMLSQRIEVLG